MGKIEEQAKYENLFKSIAKAFANKFFDETGRTKDVAETQTILPNTTAKVTLPASTSKDIQLNSKILEENADAKILKKTGDSFELSVNPGNYTFKTKL